MKINNDFKIYILIYVFLYFQIIYHIYILKIIFMHFQYILNNKNYHNFYNFMLNIKNHYNLNIIQLLLY